MKTQMNLKTGERSLFESCERLTENAGRKNGPAVFMRYSGCAALIAILAISGFIGADGQSKRQIAEAPVVSTVISEESYEKMTFDEIENRLADERKQELALLESVISDESAGQSEKNTAQTQKLNLAERMGIEAEIKAALAHMGFEKSAVICSQAKMMLMIPAQYIQNNVDSARIIDTASTVGGCEAKDVKIILVKI